MTPKLQFRPFTSSADKGWAEASALYVQSFPSKERRGDAEHLLALRDPRFRADGIWLDETFAGILYHWECGHYQYIEHLAIAPAMRSLSIGSQVLTAFCATAGRVILEIEPPQESISIRRLHFYERLGFVTNPYHYTNPSYCRPFKSYQLVLMSYPGSLTHAEALEFAEFVRCVVMKYSQHEELPERLLR